MVDPLAGSYYVEGLTDTIEAGARELIAEVDALGGAARAIERGFFQEAIARSAYEIQKAQESGEMVVVGVNRFTDDSPPPVDRDAGLLRARGGSSGPGWRSEARRDATGGPWRALGELRQAAAGTHPAHAADPGGGPRARDAG